MTNQDALSVVPQFEIFCRVIKGLRIGAASRSLSATYFSSWSSVNAPAI